MPSISPRKGAVPTRSREWQIVLVVFALAVGVRLAYLLEFSSSPTFYTPVLDSQNYDILARRLLAGNWADADLFWQPSFYPIVLAGLYGITGSSILAVKSFQAMLAGLTCLLVYWLGRRTFSRRVGIGAAFITALYGPLIFYDAELLSNVWAGLWAVVLIAVLLRARQKCSAWLMVLYGAVSGVSVLTRPTFLPFVCAGLAWLVVCLYRDEPRNRRVLVPSLVIVICMFCVVTAPIAYMCYCATGRASIVPTSGGYNLYLGNNPDSEHTESMPPWAVVRNRQLAAEHGYPGPWGENEYFAGLARDYVRTQPSSFVRGLLRKCSQLMTSREIPSYEDVYYQRQWSWIMSGLTWKLGSFGFPFGLVLPLACIGCIYWYRRWPGVLVLFPILECAAIGSAHVVGRTRTTMIPILAIFAAAGVAAAAEMWRGKQWRQWAMVFVGGVMLVCLMTIPGPFRLEDFRSAAEIPLSIGFYRYSQLRDVSGSIEAYRQALAAQPDNPAAHFNLAISLAQSKDNDGALRHYREAVRLAPDYPDFRFNLANNLVRARQLDEAVEQYRAALRIYPDWAQAHNNLAYALSLKGDRTGAIAQYQQATRLDPKFILAWLNLARLYEQDANPKQAEACYLRVLQLDSRSSHAISGLARLRDSLPILSSPSTHP